MALTLSFKREKLESIARRRAELVDRSATQRRELIRLHQEIERPLRWLDVGWNIVRTLRNNPVLISLGVATLVKLITRRNRNDRPATGFWQRMTRWPARVIEAWGVFRQVRSLFSTPRR